MRFTQTNFRKKLSSDLLGNFCIDEMFTQLTDVIKTFKRFSFYLFHRRVFFCLQPPQQKPQQQKQQPQKLQQKQQQQQRQKQHHEL